MKTRTKKYIFASLVTSIFLVFINACTLKSPMPDNNRDAIDDALRDSMTTNRSLKSLRKNKRRPNSSMQNALMPEMRMPNLPLHRGFKGNEQKFDIAVNNVKAKDFFMGLVKDTKYNMTISPLVKGNISLELKQITIPQAMDAIRDTYGFEYEKTSYGYKVFPRQLATRIFHINYLDISRSGESQTTIGSGQITSTVQNTLTSSGVSKSKQSGSVPSGIINTRTVSNFWEELKMNLLALVGDKDGRSMVINPKSGSIIVKAYPNELRHVAKYLDEIQNIIQRQVIIEAKILEIELNANFQNGINWKVLGLEQGSVLSGNVDLLDNMLGSGSILGAISMTAKSGNAFKSFISLLNSQGKVNVLSSPRIATINNQKAVIKVGTDRFFVTDVSSDTNTGSGGSTNSTSDVTLTPFFSGISLDVTPQIDENGYITLHIHPIISKVTQEDKKFMVDGKNQNLPLASSTVRESDSIVRAKSGQVIVIGGLMESEGKEYRSSTPGIDRLPGIGGLFKSNKKSGRKFELVILLRPILVEGTATWQKELHRAYTNVKSMNEDFSYNVVPTKKERMAQHSRRRH